MTDYLQIHFEINAPLADTAGEALMALGALSVTFSDPADVQPILEPAPGTAPLWQQTCVTGLFDGSVDLQNIQARLDALLQSALSYRVEPLADQDWVRAGRADFKPRCFGGRLWVCPSWEVPPQPEALNIVLDPGLAFGTGTHPTTALCLTWLAAQADLAGQTVIDYGCGSGILALAAAKLGARTVWATDHEPQALTATRDNARQNGVESRIQAVLPDALPAGLRADLLLANILANPLCELAPHFAKLLVPGGTVVLSGILAEQQEQVCAAYAQDFRREAISEQDGWLCIYFHARS